MRRQKRYVPIFKEKVECKLCDKKKNLTFHHIIPQKEIVFNGDENLMVLCRKCHNIIDVKIVARDEFCYNKNKMIIDKYNKFLEDNRFPEDLIWILYKEEKIVKIKNKKRKKNSGQNLICKKKKKEKLYSKTYLKLLKEKQSISRKIQEEKDKEKENDN